MRTVCNPNSLTRFSYFFCEVSLPELCDIIGGLKLSIAGMIIGSYSFFSEIVDWLDLVILTSCNRSLPGVFPYNFRVAKVTKNKHWSQKQFKLYPNHISLTPNSANYGRRKKTVRIQLKNYFLYFNLLVPAHLGFRACFSTNKTPHKFLDYVYRLRVNLDFMVCNLLGLSKVFDIMNRDILIKKEQC